MKSQRLRTGESPGRIGVLSLLAAGPSHVAHELLRPARSPLRSRRIDPRACGAPVIRLMEHVLGTIARVAPMREHGGPQCA